MSGPALIEWDCEQCGVTHTQSEDYCVTAELHALEEEVAALHVEMVRLRLRYAFAQQPAAVFMSALWKRLKQ